MEAKKSEQPAVAVKDKAIRQIGIVVADLDSICKVTPYSV